MRYKMNTAVVIYAVQREYCSGYLCGIKWILRWLSMRYKVNTAVVIYAVQREYCGGYLCDIKWILRWLSMRYKVNTVVVIYAVQSEYYDLIKTFLIIKIFDSIFQFLWCDFHSSSNLLLCMISIRFIPLKVTNSIVI